MTDVVTYDVVPRAGVIDLGKQVEGLVTRVVLPNIRRGEGAVQLVHQRADDQKPYLVPITEDGDKVYWIVSRLDTAYPGRGQAELQWLGVNGEVAKSATYQTNTTRSMAEPGAVPDEPLEPYTQAVARDAQAAKDAAASATEAARSAEDSAGQAGISADNAAKSLKQLTDGIASGDFRGQDGKSAYQLAVDAGFDGTETQWLESLKGAPGDTTDADAAAEAAKKAAQEAQKAAEDCTGKVSDSNSNDGFLLCDLNGNIVGHIASFEVWNDEPYNKKYGWGGHPYGNGKLPPYSKIAGIVEADLLSVCGGRGRWNKDDTGNFQHGGHLFEGWNAEEDARLTFGIGTKNKDISWIQTFHAPTQEGTDSGSYYCVTKVGSDIDNQGMNFMPSITQSRSLFSLKVGDNLAPNSKHIQKLVETGELVDWEYNKTDMIPYGTMYFDYTKDRVRVYTRTGGWKYLKFEE